MKGCLQKAIPPLVFDVVCMKLITESPSRATFDLSHSLVWRRQQGTRDPFNDRVWSWLPETAIRVRVRCLEKAARDE